MDKIKELENKIEELKEMIVGLQMKILGEDIKLGACPYTYYKPKSYRKIECEIPCKQCREEFLEDLEGDIRKEVEEL